VSEFYLWNLIYLQVFIEELARFAWFYFFQKVVRGIYIMLLDLISFCLLFNDESFASISRYIFRCVITGCHLLQTFLSDWTICVCWIKIHLFLFQNRSIVLRLKLFLLLKRVKLSQITILMHARMFYTILIELWTLFLEGRMLVRRFRRIKLLAIYLLYFFFRFLVTVWTISI
jgi:hypothetical protein